MFARDRLIQQRRKLEDTRQFYNHITQEDQKQRFLADWERNTDSKIQSRQIQERYKELRQKAKLELEQRRDRLAEKLAFEDEMYKEELDNRQETTEQRRSRLEARARQLKEARENRNKEFAQEQLYRKFLAESDELRDAKSRAMVLQYAKAREQQKDEKEDRKRFEEEEKRVYDELWEQDRLEKEKRKMREDRIQLEKNRQLREHLTEQVDIIEQKKLEMKALEEEEARLMKEKWEIEDQEEQRAILRKKKEDEKLQEEVDRFNKRKQLIRQKEVEEERQLDLRMIQHVLEKEAQETAREREYKSELRRQAREYQALLLAQMQKEKEDESELERLRDEDAEKQYAKRQAQWDAEQRARDKLMQEVIEDRKRQNAYKLKKAQEDKTRAEAERAQLESAIDRQLRIEEAQHLNKKKALEEHQEYLKRQMEAKRETEHAISHMERAQQKAQIEANRAYEMALQRELQSLEEQKPNGFTHVSTKPRAYRR
eukprot:CAMPEP_0117451162 /NCGR_PEP_ID=MMETSP0759-20121206/8861_1 /TAXON_ID=63605 /ORGANISM="Percolomonas cosmopolitus, Strain WS" /LENGTH=485 /DNA_ID=CAMNT_0005243745 /DNA_START=145 /DNA_END=1602 /DNA_ORIENTATION=-